MPKHRRPKQNLQTNTRLITYFVEEKKNQSVRHWRSAQTTVELMFRFVVRRPYLYRASYATVTPTPPAPKASDNVTTAASPAASSVAPPAAEASSSTTSTGNNNRSPPPPESNSRRYLMWALGAAVGFGTVYAIQTSQSKFWEKVSVLFSRFQHRAHCNVCSTRAMRQSSRCCETT